MRSLLKPATGLLCLTVLATAGCSAGSGDTSDAAPTGSRRTTASPSEEATAATAYAPYVSATEASDLDSTGSPTTYNLAFVISDGSGCAPKWNGTEASATRR
jgi:chitinase